MDRKVGEKQVEAYLVKRVKAIGGKAYKFVSPGNVGVPDRLVCWHRIAVFAELKAPGKKPSAQQRAKHRELRALGFAVFGCVDSYEDVDMLILLLTGTPAPDLTAEMLEEMEFCKHE